MQWALYFLEKEHRVKHLDAPEMGGKRCESWSSFLERYLRASRCETQPDTGDNDVAVVSMFLLISRTGLKIPAGLLHTVANAASKRNCHACLTLLTSSQVRSSTIQCPYEQEYNLDR